MTVMDDGYRQRKKKPCDAFKIVTEHYIYQDLQLDNQFGFA